MTNQQITELFNLLIDLTINEKIKWIHHEKSIEYSDILTTTIKIIKIYTTFINDNKIEVSENYNQIMINDVIFNIDSKYTNRDPIKLLIQTINDNNPKKLKLINMDQLIQSLKEIN